MGDKSLVVESEQWIAGDRKRSAEDLLREWIAYGSGIELGIKHDARLINEARKSLREVILGQGMQS
jgi:hypothetical protein